MAIPNNYIDKITKEGDSRPICPAADKVRVDNENFEGADLDAVLDEVAEAIEDAGGGYNPPAGGIPKTDLAQGVQDSLGLADSAVQDNNYVHTDNNYTDADAAAVATIGNKANATDVYTKAETGTAISEALIGQAIAVATGDFVLTEDDSHFYITPVVPAVSVSPEVLSFYGITKTATFKVSGANLKGNVTVATAATNWSLRIGSGTASQSLTLTPTDGTLAETTITVLYSGSADSVGNTITITSQGAEAAVVTASYTVYQGPTISVDNQSLSLEDVAGYNDGTNATKTLTVGGSQLTETIAAAITGTNANRFSVSGTLTTSGGTLAINYHPQAGDSGTHSATLTLSSSGATSVVVQLTGTVLTQSLSITPATLELSGGDDESVTGTINIKGTNVKVAVNLSVDGIFSLSQSTIAAGNSQINTANGVDVVVTATPTAGMDSSNGTIRASGLGISEVTGSVGWHKTEEAPSVGDVIVKDGLYYWVDLVPDGNTHGTLTLVNNTTKIKNSAMTAATYSGAIVVPDTITYAGELYDIIGIGSFAFFNSAITSIQLTDGKLTSIGNGFIQGTSVDKLVIPDSVTSMSSQLGGFRNVVVADFGLGAGKTRYDIIGSNFNNSTKIKVVILRFRGQNGGVFDGNESNYDGGTSVAGDSFTNQFAYVPNKYGANLWSSTNVKVFIPSDDYVIKHGVTRSAAKEVAKTESGRSDTDYFETRLTAYQTARDASNQMWPDTVNAGKAVFYDIDDYDPTNQHGDYLKTGATPIWQKQQEE